SNLQQQTNRVAASEHGNVSLEVWSTPAEPRVHILSLAAGNAHLVVTLHSRQVLHEMRDFIEAHRGQARAEWFEIGTFASCAVNVYTNKAGVTLVCDGHESAGFSE